MNSNETTFKLLDVQHEHLTVGEHVRHVVEGDYALPEFQRTFVWDAERIAKLWDSMYKGYPVGQLMLWKPANTETFPMRALGRQQSSVEKTDHLAVLDGQQRLTALLLVMRGEVEIRFDLDSERFLFSVPAAGWGPNHIRLDIIRGADNKIASYEETVEDGFFNRHASEAQKRSYGKIINRLNAILNTRQLPSQTVKGSDYPTVISVFERLNEQGAPLNEAQITMAGICRHWPGVFGKTYDLLGRMNSEMGFDRSEDPTFVFQVWTAVHTGQHLIKHLAPRDSHSRYASRARADLYEQSWQLTEAGINRLIHVMKTDLGLTNFQFIKSYFPLAVAAHYLATHTSNTDIDRQVLVQWLLLSLVSGRYHERALSKYNRDIKATSEANSIERLFDHGYEPLDPRKEQSFLLESKQLIQEDFRSAYVTLLYLIARRLNATDFYENGIIVGDSNKSWQLHHIFPRKTFDGDRWRLKEEFELAEESGDEEKMQSIRKEEQLLESKVNSLCNLAFLTAQTNISISDNDPSQYLKLIARTKDGRKALEAQMIPIDAALWKHSAFDAFLDCRAKLITEKAKEVFFS